MNPEVRDAIHSSIGSFYDYLKENYSDYEKLWADFLKALDKEYKKIQELPQEQQAEAIGKITGNIMATIIGAKATSAAIKSGKLRLKFKSTEVIPKKTMSNLKIPKKQAGISGKIKYEAKTPVKAITDIGEVKTWADLERYVSTIDRVRFKK
jgi:hypothetical protein